MDVYEEEVYEALQKYEAEMMYQAEQEAPLLQALKAGRKTEVKYLLAAGADANVRSPLGSSAALHIAALRGERGTASTLLKYGAEKNALDDAGETPLMKAAQLGHQRVVELLIEAGADINVFGKALDSPYGRTYGSAALHYAAGRGHHGIVKALLKHGADVNAQDNRGDTPLHYAVDIGREEIVSTLLEFNANALVANRDHQTALVWAARDGKGRLMEMMTAARTAPGKSTGMHLDSRTDQMGSAQAMINEEFNFGQRGQTETAGRFRGVLDLEGICLAVALLFWFSARGKLRS